MASSCLFPLEWICFLDYSSQKIIITKLAFLNKNTDYGRCFARFAGAAKCLVRAVQRM